MSRELILIRHARAEWGNPAADAERILSSEGRNEAERLGTWLAEQHITPDYVLCSSATRTRQTWDILAGTLEQQPAVVLFEPRLYLAELPVLLQILQAIAADVRRVTLLGHNPGLEQLAAHISAEPLPRNSIGEIFATANLLRFAVPDDWCDLHARGKVLNFFRPQPY